MTRIKYILILLSSILLINENYGQSEDLTGSPYSLYGLGIPNETSTGKTNALGRSGIAISSENEINNLNPASYGQIKQNSFFFDIGMKGRYDSFSNKISSDKTYNFNVANVAMAFSVNKNSGMGITLTPYTSVGYSIIGIQKNIEGSSEIFISNITGTGGLNDFRLNYGYSFLDKKLQLGLSTSVLFGSIEETESIYLSVNYLTTNKKTSYKGYRFGLGLQYRLMEKLTIASTIKLPTVLNGSLDRSVTKTIDGEIIVVEDDENKNIADFNLPLEVGFGILYKYSNRLAFNADFKRNFWSDTEQTDYLGDYKDQNVFAIGAEFIKNKNSLNYFERINYRIGYNFDSGYLSVNNTEINSQSITMGLGFPLNRIKKTAINISYSYGEKGKIQNFLIKEKYHLFTLNLSLGDIWFLKRKIY